MRNWIAAIFLAGCSSAPAPRCSVAITGAPTPTADACIEASGVGLFSVTADLPDGSIEFDLPEGRVGHRYTIGPTADGEVLYAAPNGCAETEGVAWLPEEDEVIFEGTCYANTTYPIRIMIDFWRPEGT